MKYIYGMRLRGFSPMCQPKGVVERRDDPTGKYYDLIVYNRGLTHEELEDYELDYVGTEGKEMEEKVLTLYRALEDFVKSAGLYYDFDTDEYRFDEEAGINMERETMSDIEHVYSDLMYYLGLESEN